MGFRTLLTELALALGLVSRPRRSKRNIAPFITASNQTGLGAIESSKNKGPGRVLSNYCIPTAIPTD